MAQRLAKDLADPGLVIVSGLVRGIDASAHRGALNSTNGVTIGLLGCGIDVVYPRENKRLFDEITQRGAVVTEFPMGTFPGAQNFPIRKRIIAGIAPGSVRAELVPVESVSHAERAALVEENLEPGERPLYELLSLDEARHADELVELSGRSSPEVLAALFDLELKGVVRQLPGKQFLKVLL